MWVQRARHRWLSALHLEAAICQLKLVCHSNPNSLQPFQSVPPQVGTSGRAAITLHTRCYYSCLPIHLILPSFVKRYHLFFSSLSISSRFGPPFSLQLLAFIHSNKHPYVMRHIKIIHKSSSPQNISF